MSDMLIFSLPCLISRSDQKLRTPSTKLRPRVSRAAACTSGLLSAKLLGATASMNWPVKKRSLRAVSLSRPGVPSASDKVVCVVAFQALRTALNTGRRSHEAPAKRRSPTRLLPLPLTAVPTDSRNSSPPMPR